MKNIYKYIGILVLSLCVSSGLFGQQKGIIKGGLNLDDFPEVSFVYHTNSPDQLDDSDFSSLKESGESRKFTVNRLSNTNVDQPQNILILWEDMASNGTAQFEFTRKTLLGFFNNVYTKSQDCFAISTFNRRTNTASASKCITNGFTNDKRKLINAIDNYECSKREYKDFPNCSDLYTAIREGLELLAPLKNTKAIIVFTAGHPMTTSGSDSEAQVLLKAQQLHIPVYIFQYYKRSGIATESEGFAKSTYGYFKSYEDASAAEGGLTHLYSEINKRYQGHDYKITFTSGAKRNDDMRVVALSVNGVEVQEQLFPPAHTFKTFAEEYLWALIAAVVVLIGLIIGIILFIRKTNKNAKANKATIEELEQKRLKDIEAAKQQQIQQENQRKAAEELAKKQQEQKRLQDLMQIKNVYPRLKCSIGSDFIVYEISKPTTVIGREDDCDVVLNSAKVSRYHARIEFNGSGFEVIDTQSTNKVNLNGMNVDRAVLKSGDRIILGDVIVTFI